MPVFDNHHQALDPVISPCSCSAGFSGHKPKPARTVVHHVVPQSWGGSDVTANQAIVCDNHHYGAHTVIDEYVRLSKSTWPLWTSPPKAWLKSYDSGMQSLAVQAITGYLGKDWPGFTL